MAEEAVREAAQWWFESTRGHMQKSENKIKPMSFYSDGYKEYGILESSHGKPNEEELEADESSCENNGKFIKRSAKRRNLKSVLKKIAEVFRQSRRYYR